jgi:hypothetical protein
MRLRTDLRHSLGTSCSSWQGLHVFGRVGSDGVEDRPEALLGNLLQLLAGVACVQEGW